MSEGPAGEAEEWVFYLLFQTVRRRDAAFARALEPLELDLGKWRALSVIHRLEDCTMNELAEFTTIDRTTLTRTVDQLIAGAMVERRESATDRRRVCLRLTSLGQDRFVQGMAMLRSFNRRALEGIADAELDGLRALLGKVIHNVTGSERHARSVLHFERPR